MKYAYIFPPLNEVNVRQSPSTRAKVVGTLKINQRIQISGERSGDGWWEILSPVAGWVFNGVKMRIDPPLPPEGTPIADGFDAPIGTLEERQSDKVWGGEWYDAAPFARLYFKGQPNEAYHTGADLNLPRNEDAGANIYAAASGVVLVAKRFPVWGNIIVIKHDPVLPNDPSSPPYAVRGRYAHMQFMSVKAGQRVNRGDVIGTVGDAFGRYSHHLHFDLSPTDILDTFPHHWPAKNLNELLYHYIDPREWIINHRPNR